MKNALALALVLLLAACGGGGDSGPSEVPLQIGANQATTLNLSSGVTALEFAPVSYTNNTGAAVDVELTLTASQTLSALSGFTGEGYATVTMSVRLNEQFLVGPAGPEHPENGPRFSLGNPISWAAPATWRIHLNPGDHIDAHAGMTIVLPNDSRGPLLLQMHDLSLTIN